MRYSFALRLFGLVLFALLTSFVTSSVATQKRRQGADPVEPPRVTRTEKVSGANPDTRETIVVPGESALSVITKAQFDVDGHTVRVRATAQLEDRGIDYLYMWSIGVYSLEDRTRSNPLFQIHDTEDPFAPPAHGKLNPTFDHRLVVPLPAGKYRIQVALLEIPSGMHRKGIAVQNHADYIGTGVAKSIVLTD